MYECVYANDTRTLTEAGLLGDFSVTSDHAHCPPGHIQNNGTIRTGLGWLHSLCLQAPSYYYEMVCSCSPLKKLNVLGCSGWTLRETPDAVHLNHTLHSLDNIYIFEALVGDWFVSSTAGYLPRHSSFLNLEHGLVPCCVRDRTVFSCDSWFCLFVGTRTSQAGKNTGAFGVEQCT